jgi:hypothetical protein
VGPKIGAHTLLIKGVSQYEVDFVIPRAGVDLPLGIDPFLLYKSRDPIFGRLHGLILKVINSGVDAVREGDVEQARALFRFPEVSAIGMGYSESSKRGSGVGEFTTELVIETLQDSLQLQKRGIRHVEELQLLSVGIGPDRVSDIVANILKRFLIEYTQRQCAIWNIPVQSGVPLENIYDEASNTWSDSYESLPLSPYDQSPMLFVPRRIVRTLPWINYAEFFQFEFSAFLRSKRAKARLAPGGSPSVKKKEDVTTITRADVGRIENYVRHKEETAAKAQPSTSYVDSQGICPESETLKNRLAALKPGIADATGFQLLVLEIFNFLFNPDLIDGVPEVKTIDGTERRDIIFTNDSDKTFWEYLRNEHSSLIVMIETKNTAQVENSHLNQTATYLGSRLGYFGIIVTRTKPEEAQIKKSFSIYSDSQPKKIILILCDQDLIQMLDMHCAGRDPMRYMQTAYRNFRTSVQ